MTTPLSTQAELTRKDFVAPNDVRWCPSCGDYAILNSMLKTFPTLGVPKENFVVISGIGCSSRLPYYMDTYGFHSIHGRAPTLATGIKSANPDLSVWVITGDGDGLSIGGNHLLHALRRNIDINIILFNNRIYGLTKGQYSPTSEVGKKTKTSPLGSIDAPINPLCISLAAETTFVARTMDTNPKHMSETFAAAAKHKGTSFVEVMQNCIIFNNGTWNDVSARDVRDERMLMLEHGKPLIFGKDRDKGIGLNGLKLEIIDLKKGGEEEDILIHDALKSDPSYAYFLSQMSYPEMPTPIGVFRNVQDRPTYESQLQEQIDFAIEKNGKGDLQSLLTGSDTWEVSEKEVSHSSWKGTTSDFVAAEMEIMKEQIHEEKKDQDPYTSSFRLPVKSILKDFGFTDVLSVKPSDSIQSVIDIFREKNIGSVLVQKGKQLRGIITVADIVLKVVNQDIDRAKTPISVCMTINPEVMPCSGSISEAIHRFSIRGLRHLIISMEDGSYAMLSIKGLMQFLYSKTSKGS